MSWITVASFLNENNAHVLQGKLESEGIETNVTGDQMVRMYGQAARGVEVQVQEIDLDQANLILKKARLVLKKTETEQKS